LLHPGWYSPGMQGCKGIAAGIVGMDVGAFGTSMLCPLRYSAASSPRRGE
jgi:hypothetical protein